MNEFINFLQTNFVTITTLLGGTGAVASAYLYNTRHHRYGYQIGKKVTVGFKPEFDKRLTSPHSQKSMPERVEQIKDMVFQVGLSEYIKDYNQRVSRLEQQISSFKEETRIKKETATKMYEDNDKKLEEEIEELEHSLKTKEEELSQLKKLEDEKNEALDQSNKVKTQNTYFFSTLIQKARESLTKTTQQLETHLLRYVYFVVIALLLIGDYYITFFIFNDVLKIQFKDNKAAIYIFSGIIALVFLVLIERAIDFLEKSSGFRKYIKKIQTFSMLVVGLILLTIYLLMVSLSWLNDIPEVLDSLLRLLFVPLIVAVAISVRKIQKEHSFSFLFTPIKVVLSLVLILLFNALLLFEVILNNIRKYLQKEKFESKVKLTLAEEVDYIRGEIVNKNDLRLSLKQQLEAEINKITENYQTLVTKLEEKLENLNAEMAKVRRGCESGVVSALQLPVPNLKN